MVYVREEDKDALDKLEGTHEHDGNVGGGQVGDEEGVRGHDHIDHAEDQNLQNEIHEVTCVVCWTELCPPLGSLPHLWTRQILNWSCR